MVSVNMGGKQEIIKVLEIFKEMIQIKVGLWLNLNES